MMRADYAGLNGFIWWVGVVEDRKDPLKLGRCKVRIVGWHSADKMSLPTEKLPFAQAMLPLNNPHPYAPKESDMVMGFFLDGENAQQPVMMGVMPSIPLAPADNQAPYNDPRTQEEIDLAPVKPNETANGYPRLVDEPITSRLARNETANTSSVVSLKKERITANNTSSVEREPYYNAEYPYNKVYESESGHALEFDDTRDNERVHLYHRAGSYMEYGPDGSMVERVQKDKFSVTVGDESVLVKGDVSITVEGDVTMQVNGNYDLNVNGDIKVNGATINLNNGSQGAARIGDTVADVDPVGDGTISSGSGTVKIGG
tara:strand:+ start:4041 stop:4988 length:948 start_codon:yes stop_codon:yes gene_type:complete